MALQSAAAQIRERLRSPGDGPVKERVRAAIKGLVVAALATDDQARLIAVNQAALLLTGYSEQELLRLGVPDITAPSDVPHTNVLWEAFLREGQQRGKYDLRTKSGATVTAEYLALAHVVPGVHVSLLQPTPDP